jgi:hypothetical protein
MEDIPYHDFRGFFEAAKKVSEWRAIEGADWDSEIGALIEATAELDSRPMLVFDKIRDCGIRLSLKIWIAGLGCLCFIIRHEIFARFFMHPHGFGETP